MHRLLKIGAVILTVGVLAYAGVRATKAQGAPAMPQMQAKHVMIAASDVKFGPAPAGLPAGAQMAVLDGDPSQTGVPFTLRVKVPAGYKVPPHWHPTDENLVILSGAMMMGLGEKFNEASMHTLGPGAYAKMPKQTNHYVMAKAETVFQLHAIGPFEITYVNPNDDPRKKTTTK